MNFLKESLLAELAEIENILTIRQTEMEHLRCVINSYELPEKFLASKMGESFVNINRDLSFEIENLLKIEIRLKHLFKRCEYKQKSAYGRIMVTLIKWYFAQRRLLNFCKELEKMKYEIRKIDATYFFKSKGKVKIIRLLPSRFWLKLVLFLYSSKDVKEVFEPIASDWQEEYFEVLSKKEIWKTRWINVRYTYAFLLAMWQKSPIGDLIEFILKVAK